MTARREMYQELEVCCQGWKLIGCLDAREGYWRRSSTESFRRHTTFYVQGEVETPEIHPRRGELSDARWFKVGAFPDDRSDNVDFAVTAGCLGLRHRVDATAAPDHPLGPPLRPSPPTEV